MRRISAVLVAGIMGLALLASCSFGPQGISPQDVERLSQLTDRVAQVQQLVQETQSEVQALNERVSQAEDRLRSFASAGSPVLDTSQEIPDPPEGRVALRLRFTYRPDALPGDGIQAYTPDPKVNSLWAMASLPPGKALPVGKPLDQSTLFLRPGESAMVTLAYQNPTDREVQFLVLPHAESPASLAQYVWPTCLCMSFAYKAPAGGAWYRVIRLTVSPDMPPGSKVDVVWLVLTDPSVFPGGQMAAATPTPAAPSSRVALGEALARENGCLTCHTADGSPGIGPTWKGLFGRTETLSDGSKVVVDEDYLYESIVNPNAKVVQGFPANVMPQDYGEKLSKEEIEAIIEYIRSLK